MTDEYNETTSETRTEDDQMVETEAQPSDPAEQEGRQTPAVESGGKKRWTRIQSLKLAGVILAVLLAVSMIFFAVYRSIVKPPELRPPEAEVQSPSESPAQEEEEAFDGIKPYVTGARKQDYYTFLLVGRDVAGGGLTDTIMLAAYDVPNQDLNVMSIPRDTMVNASWDVKKINSVYNIAGGGEAGMESLKGYVSDLIGFEPDFTITIEWEAVGELVDAIGGVWFEIPFNMYYRDSYQDLFINQPKGYRLLDGEDAMEVIRWRKNNSGVSTGSSETDGSDLARTRVQQDFIAAVIKQCLQLKNVTKINEIASVFTEYVDTELTVGNLVWFAEQALLGGFSTENMYACTMPNTAKNAYSRSYHAYLSYVVPNASELIEIVNQHFNPYQSNVTLANLDIMSVNADGSVSSSTGTVKDSQAAKPVVKEPETTEPVDENEIEPVEPEETPTASMPEETPTPDVTPVPTPGGDEPGSPPPDESQGQPSDVPTDQPEEPSATPSETAPVESIPVQSAPVDLPPAESGGDDLFTLPEGVT